MSSCISDNIRVYSREIECSQFLSKIACLDLYSNPTIGVYSGAIDSRQFMCHARSAGAILQSDFSF